jgi:hypothetical protein|tara:strand:+ start:1133 stop:2704 length:1572 start_codon:yes stop_codon:yes gene_type:complete
MTLSIQPCTGYKISTKSLTEIKDMYLNGELDTYDVWLQRLKQKNKWASNDWAKARSYLFRLFTSGNYTKSTYTVANINMLIDKIEERISSLSTDSHISSIFNKMVEALKLMKEGGCKFILLDGQNRLEYALKLFFTNKLEWRYVDKLTQIPKKLTFVDKNNMQYSKESFYYKDLSSEEKDVIDDIKIIFANGMAGEIDEYIDDLIDDNSGEHWNDFEKKITNLKTLPYLVNTALSKSTKAKGSNAKEPDNVPSFKQILDKVGSLTGAYSIEKKGYHKVICELTQLDMNGTLNLDYEVMWDTSKHEKITKSFNNVKEFFNSIARCSGFPLSKQVGGKNIFATKELLRNFYMITQILKKGAKGYKVPLSKIKNLRAIYNDYMKLDNFKRDRKRNPEDFVILKTAEGKDGSPVAKPATYIWSMRSIDSTSLTCRRSILNAFVEEHIEDWINNSVIDRLDRTELTDNEKQKVVLEAQEDPFSVHGETLDPLVDNIHVDHIEQFGRGGSNDISNLQATTASSNLSRVK